MGKILSLLLLSGLANDMAWAEFDPTAPPALSSNDAAKDRPGGSGLAWVRVNGKDSIAWYDNAPVKLGDLVEGGRIVVIREDHIEIAGREGRHTVRLLDPGVQHNPAARLPTAKHN